MPHAHLSVPSTKVISLMPNRPDVERLLEADFGDEADMASYTDDLPAATSKKRGGKTTVHPSERKR
ncbi:MAG: hypothetical protein JO171_10595 [Paludibacterium sp.]|uniref:hypothetical protein n=1 Tax=Paludibacterium sp. TaxID=1917523 RepID=UPI0025D06530|nr:hypothetical protein [Paludibacterium sp.]MBV8047594.1 hypothetical protein [Paludibacterium sp.]MBV8646889.1 hypothetical protein [Paludibacterium sp.]